MITSFEFGLGEPVVFGDLQMGSQLFGASVGDHGGDGDQGCVAGWELGSPDVAEQCVVGQGDQFRGEVSSPPSAAKHGVIGLTRSAALEYAPRGIRINAICPGTIKTPMVTDMIAKGELSIPEAVANQPIGRLGRADEIAAAVLWLSSPAASLIIGVALPVDGGYTAR